MTITAGTRLDHYEIIAPLGAGGMGEVYRARDARLDREVALKLLPAEFAHDADRLRRFEQEARATSALNHPNILTVYDLGEHDGAPYLVAELLAGAELRVHLRGGPLAPPQAVEYARQIAAGLAAAHTKGVVHRDLKPENLFVTTDGRVKILDFGLAKLKPQFTGPVDKEAATLKPFSQPGLVLGTPQYMSPEQARGQETDARTDIFSLGVVLYEMLAGRAPFVGESFGDLLAEILKTEPAPLTGENLPAELPRIVTKMLCKDRRERYATAQELLDDLQELHEEMLVQARLARRQQRDADETKPQPEPAFSVPPSETAFRVPPSEQAFRVPPSGGESRNADTPPEGGTLNTVRRRAALLAVVALIVIAAIAAFFYFNRNPALTDKDMILLTEFDNRTREEIFDGTLKQGLAVQLQQSPFLSLFPDARMRDTLKLMNRSPDERVTRNVGREICQRQGVKALIAGTIAKFERNYSITLEAINSQSGESIALTQVEAEGKDQVLKALSQAATQMREKLGESLASIQKFDKPIYEVTTANLDALKAFSQGQEMAYKGKRLEAIPFYKRAIEFDPDFASAYQEIASRYINTLQPGLAAEYAIKAYALRGRVSEYEKLRIAFSYHAFATGELDKAIEALEQQKQTYPRDASATQSLARRYSSMGQYEKAVEEGRETLRRDPNEIYGYIQLGAALTGLNRFVEAKEVLAQGIQKNLDDTTFRLTVYRVAFLNGDVTAMQKQLDSMRGKPDEYAALDWQTGAAAFAGQWKQAQDFSRRAIDFATRNDVKEVAARYAAEQALRAAVFYQVTQAKTKAAQSLALARNQVTLTRVALALALAGSTAQAQSLVDELTKKYPKDTIINGIWLPTIKAALELPRGNAAAAIAQLQPILRYEAAAEFWPQYVRGQAYLKLGKPAAAAAEFQKILDHHGQAPLSALYPLAHLGLARAAILQGDTALAKQSYDEFFRLWKDADADLPVLVEAKKEYAKLK